LTDSYFSETKLYLLYIDESGGLHQADQHYFVLAGVCIFERQGYWLAQKLDEIAARFDPADPNSIELHGSPMFGGRKQWRQFPKETRHQALEDILQVLKASHPSNRIFASVIRREAISPEDPVLHAFEQIASRFDYYLQRLHRSGDTHRGLIVFDKSTYETTIQNLATDFRTVGHSWGILRNLAEVPLFLDSRASRLIQVADIIAYSTYRAYEHGDHRFFSIIQDRFDSEGGTVHGLYVRQ
jgi:hypothetical protein